MKKIVFITGMLMLGFWSCKKDSKPLNQSLPNGTTGTVSDVEGNVYKTVKIGDQWWMAENLKTTKLNDGTTSIPVVELPSAWANIQNQEPMMCYYNNDLANKNTYGGLYNWYTVNTGKLAPAGWHVPTDADWNKLITYLGGSSVAGTKLKEEGEMHWVSGNTGTNSTGFSVFGGGFRNDDGVFFGIGTVTGVWSSNEFNLTNSSCYSFNVNTNGIISQYPLKKLGLYVRCVKD